MSGLLDAHQTTELGTLNIDSLLTKPFTTEALLNTLNRIFSTAN